MSVPTKIVVGVAGGYLLGRTRKLRLALALGGVLAGRRLASQQGQGLQGLLSQGSKLLESNPQLKELQNQVRGHLVEAAREAALFTAASRIDALTKSLQAHQQTGGEQDGEEQGQPQGEADEDQPSAELEEAQEQEQEQPEGEAGEGQPSDEHEESDEEERSEEQRSARQEQPRERPRRPRPPEGRNGDGSDGSRKSSPSEAEATPRAVAKKVSAQKAGNRLAGKGR